MTGKIKLKEIYIFMPLLAAYFVLGVIYPFLIKEIPKFLLFQFFFMLLPGYVFSKWFISENLTKIQRLIFGYPVSMVLLFILSWIGKSLKVNYLEGVILLFSIAAIYMMNKEKRLNIQNEAGAPILQVMLFYGACIAITFRMFILPSSPPTPENPGLFYIDSLWTTGITWSYIRGFPLEDPKFAGVLFGYHMLQSIFQATVSNFTRIDPVNIHFYIEPIFDWFIMVFLVFYGGIKIAKFSLRKIIIFCIGLFFTTAFLTGVFQRNLFVNPLSFSFGLPAFILFIYYIISYLNRERQLDIIYLTVLFIYFTATKSILGIAMPIVLIILFLLNWNKKGFPRKETSLIFGLFLGAILLKFTMLQNATLHKLYYSYDPAVSRAYQLFNKVHIIKNYIHIVYPIYRFFSSFFRLLPKYIFNWQVLLFFIVFSVNKEFRKKMKEIKNPIKFIFVFFIISIILACLFDTTGGRIYLISYPQLIFLFLGVYSLDYILSLNNLKYKSLAVSLLILGMSAQAANLISWVKWGWGGMPNDKERIWDKRASISYDEFSAMEWLKKNIEPDEVFFSDRRYFAHAVTGADIAGFYAYSALSGRQAFAEGEGSPMPFPGKFRDVVIERWDLINIFLSSQDASEQEEVLKNIRADYFIQSLRFNNRDFSKVRQLKSVYENKDIKIFKILRKDGKS